MRHCYYWLSASRDRTVALTLIRHSLKAFVRSRNFFLQISTIHIYKKKELENEFMEARN